MLKVFVIECFRSHLKSNFFRIIHILLLNSCVYGCFTFTFVLLFLFRMYFIDINSNHPVRFCSSFFLLLCALEWPICDKNGLSIAAIFSQISDFPS